ncbi:MAG: hypothetical protein HY874_03725 [Chloroflexi bacterium]|nr:hypothetical protein [Chloroflexota bacterium]
MSMSTVMSAARPQLTAVLAAPVPGPRAIIPAARWEQLALRVGLIATGALAFNMALQSWQMGDIGSHPAVVGMVFVQYALAFALLVGGVMPVNAARRAAPLIAIAVLYSLASWSYIKIEINLRVYGTDNAAFSHVAAEKLLEGANPYQVHDRTVIEESAFRFGVPATFVTSTTDGQTLDNLMSWPAGSVLVLAPALALGLQDMRWVVVGFEVAVIVLLWLRAPAPLRPVVLLPIVVDPDLFLQFTGGGVMDFIWVLPMLFAAIALYGGRLHWSALCYGLAAGIKQQPWLLAPFLAIYLWNTRHEDPLALRARAVAVFGAVAAAGFLALNAPFVVWGLSDWMRGVLLPFREQLVPFGSGISLLTQTGAVGLPKDFYSAATFGVWGALILIYALYFRSLRHALWLAPAIIMWFGYRSLQNYYVYWIPMLLVALIAWWEEEADAAAIAPAR